MSECKKYNCKYEDSGFCKRFPSLVNIAANSEAIWPPAVSLCGEYKEEKKVKPINEYDYPEKINEQN